MKFLRAATALAAAALVLTACGSSIPDKEWPTRPSTDGGTSTDDATSSDDGGTFDPLAGTDSALAEFYGQDVDWQSCGSNLECADVVVPLDYANPDDGRTVRLHVGVLGTAGSNSPGLFLNPGGPGGSGFAMLDWIEHSISGSVTSTYNLVGFDPRGVNTSDAVSCLSDQERDEWNEKDWDLETATGFDEMTADYKWFVDKCVENTPADLLEFIDTDSAARDLDILRAVVGQQDTLDYLGYSYGTFLGAQYAELFPERVGAFVLDGALDPTLSMQDMGKEQTLGFEKAIRAYMEDCLAGVGCPFSGSVEDGLDQLNTFFDMVTATPLPTSDPNRDLGVSGAVSAVLIGLYESSLWGEISNALDLAMNDGDGSALQYWADVSVSRLDDGTYEDNSADAFLAITCLDYPVVGNAADWKAAADEVKELAPFWQDTFSYTEVICSQWPYEAERTPAPVTAAGSAPILVIGTTGDPATPYEWSEALVSQLENGHLLTFEGNGHTAYGRSNSCIQNAVDEFLLNGTIPAEGTTC